MEKRSVLRGVDPVCSADVRYSKIGRKKKWRVVQCRQKVSKTKLEFI